MIVEFIGLPGSGKTYITNYLIRDLNFKVPEVPRYTMFFRIKHLIRAITNRDFIIVFLKAFSSFKDLRKKIHGIKGLVYMNNYEKSPYQIIIYDQHILQKLISLEYILNIDFKPDQIKNFLIFFKIPDKTVIIHNDVPLSIVLKRFILRRNSEKHNKTLFDEYDEKELKREFIIMNSLVKNMITKIQAEGFTVYNVSNVTEEGVLSEVKKKILVLK